MSYIESADILDPFGSTTQVSKMTIDLLPCRYNFNNAIKQLNTRHTFSTWVKANRSTSITINNTIFDIPADEWTHIVHTFISANNTPFIGFSETGEYYFWHTQLEIGNKSSAWKEAPEDLDTQLESGLTNVYQQITEQRTSIIEEAQRIILNATETLVSTGEYDEFKQVVESQLSIMANEIVASFTTVNENIANVDGDMQEQFSKFYKHITMNENGITITSGDNSIDLRLDNEDGILFSKNGNTFGSWDGENFHTGNIVIDVTQRAQFGNFAFVPRTDGSLSFLKVR